MQCACAVIYCHLWPLRVYNIFPHFLINCTIFGNIVWNISHSRRTERDILINVLTSSCKVTVILVKFEWKLNFLYRFSKNTQISNFIVSGIRFVLCGRTEKDKTKLTVAFPNFSNAPKNVLITVLIPEYCPDMLCGSVPSACWYCWLHCASALHSSFISMCGWTSFVDFNSLIN